MLAMQLLNILPVCDDREAWDPGSIESTARFSYESVMVSLRLPGGTDQDIDGMFVPVVVDEAIASDSARYIGERMDVGKPQGLEKTVPRLNKRSRSVSRRYQGSIEPVSTVGRRHPTPNSFGISLSAISVRPPSFCCIC